MCVQWQSFVSSKRHPDRVKSDICVTSARHVENGDNWLLAGTRDHRRFVPPRGQDVAVLTAPAWYMHEIVTRESKFCF